MPVTSRESRARLHLFILPIAAFIAVLPLFLHGCSCGHDFDFHILNWLEAARQFRHGNLHPQWAFTPAYNAGEPRFIFYPPLSWTIGAILGLIVPPSLGGWSATPILYTWLTLTAAGLSLHRLARNFTSPTAALLAAAFYIVNPYMLFTAFERTAYAELLAAAIIPLLLDGILRPRVTIPSIAIPVALLWLTNAPAAVMSCYALALLTLIRLLQSTSRLHLALRTAAGTALGLGLASFYLIPAAYQRRYIQIAMAILPGARVQDNFLFHLTGLTPDDLLHDQVLHTASLIAITLLTLTALTLLLTRTTTKPGGPSFRSLVAKGWGIVQSTTALPIILLTLTITLLLTPISAPIWHHTPQLAFLQFPWRLLAIQAAVLSLTLALALRTIKLRSTLTAAIALSLVATLTYPADRLFHQPCNEEDTVPARVAQFHSTSGTEPTDEYTPITADNDALALANPPYWLSLYPIAAAPANSQPGPAPQHLSIASPIPQSLILNRRDYPTWTLYLNHTPITARQPREDGLIAIPIPPGTSQIDITPTRLTDQTLGTFTSLLSLAILGLISLRKSPKSLPLKPQSP